MHSNHAGTTAPRRITALHEFFKTSNGDLFAVRQGARTLDVLEQASVFLCVALDAVNRLAAETEDMRAYGASYLVEIAKGALDSAEVSCRHDEAVAKATKQELSLPTVLESLIEESRRGVAEGRTKRGQTFHAGRLSALEEVLEHVREACK
ncbi:MAG: hypothetical protein EKK49_08815 [Rhodocyclaceae bacterium]|nr:MAG: hypothetical protein EKK49_08815 [Rhodocyclaceae bacterium]